MKKNRKKNKTNWQYFDNCPICQAQKKVDEEGRLITETELKNAFEESKKVKGAIVGSFSDQKDPSIN